MKKLGFALVSVLVLAIMLCSCSNAEKPASNNDDPAGVVNPVSDSSIEDMAKGLNLKPIKFDDRITVGDVAKIDADDTAIYSIAITEGDKDYDVRVSLDNDGDEDISGVYFSEDAEKSIFDSSNFSEAPTMTIDMCSEGTKAYGEWKGYLFSVSCTEKLSTYNFQKLVVEIAQTVINIDKIELKFGNSNKAGLVNIDAENFDYPVNTYRGSVTVVAGDKRYLFADALKRGVIVPDDIITMCEKDAKEGKITSITYKDGGTKEYYYKNYTVMKMQIIDGATDLVIGPSGSMSEAYDLFIKN